MGEEERILEEMNRLREEHRGLDALIMGLEDAAGGFDQLRLQRLKKRKLWLKDRLAQLDAELYPDIIA
jgi:hypothetical protein